MRPVIGITSYVEVARWGAWDRLAALVPYTYVEAVRAAGGRAVLLPPDDLDGDVVSRVDGLLLAGGADVDPARYHAPAHPRTVSRPDRDAGEATVLSAALAADLPVLAVCRGMQLLAVTLGGRLHQHLPELVGHEGHQPVPGTFGAQQVSTVPGSRIAAILGGNTAVSCHHHQAVADPGPLVPTAYTADGVVEALEDPARRFLLGVQWHPEETPGDPVVAAFVRAAAGTV